MSFVRMLFATLLPAALVLMIAAPAPWHTFRTGWLGWGMSVWIATVSPVPVAAMAAGASYSITLPSRNGLLVG